ncbi:MAG TPA: hypothetical protein VGD50_01825 [Candidatus Baltobacteraceae bacterium]
MATVGLNPSNVEFVDENNWELRGECQRLQTLHSLGLAAWSDVNAEHLEQIVEWCKTYFERRPYNRWFKPLETVFSGADAQYYGVGASACHLDLVPFATHVKWGKLSSRQRGVLQSASADCLAYLIAGSPISGLILNGASVVRGFQSLTKVRMESREQPTWNGISYKCVVAELAGMKLDREVLVMGYNHNIPGTPVNGTSLRALRAWVAEELLAFDR